MPTGVVSLTLWSRSSAGSAVQARPGLCLGIFQTLKPCVRTGCRPTTSSFQGKSKVFFKKHMVSSCIELPACNTRPSSYCCHWEQNAIFLVDILPARLLMPLSPIRMLADTLCSEASRFTATLLAEVSVSVTDKQLLACNRAQS